MSDSAITTSATTTTTTPRGGVDLRADQPTPRAPPAVGAVDRACSARRTTTSITMHATSVPSSSVDRRTATMTPKQQPLTSQLLEALPETSLVWPAPRRGASSTGRPSGRTPSQHRLDVSTTSGTTSGTSSRCRSANIVTPHRAPIPAPPPLLDDGRSPHSGRHHRQQHHHHSDPSRSTGPNPHSLSLDLVPLGEQSDVWSFHVHPSEAPAAAYEAEAAAMTPEALKAAVRTLREDVRVLNTSVERDRAQLAHLQSGMSKLYADVERQQESITNTLLRRIHRVTHAKERLRMELHQIECEKADRRAKLAETKQSVGRVKRHMKREEAIMVQRLEQKLRHQQQQREQLDSLLEEHAASLQTLEKLVNEVQSIELPALAASSEASSILVTATPQRRSSALSTSSAASASAPRSPRAQSAARLATPHGTTGMPPPSPLRSRGTNSTSVTPPPAASAAHSTGGAFLAAQPRHERSSSQASVGSSTVVTEHTAYDPREMVAYLEQEIAAVESMRADVVSRANAYQEKCAQLRKRLDHGAVAKGEGKRRLSQVEQALEDTTTRATALAVAQQLAEEVDSERVLNEALASGRTPPQLSSATVSANATPRHSFTRSPLIPAGLSHSTGMPSVTLGGMAHHRSISTTEASLPDLHDSVSSGRGLPSHSPQQRVSQLSVQSTSRMEPPRPLMSSNDTTPAQTPQRPRQDAGMLPPALNLNADTSA